MKKLGVFIFLSVFILVSMNFISADTQVYSWTNDTDVEGANTLINFTLNVSRVGSETEEYNITQVMVIMPSGADFVNESNGTGADATVFFGNDSSISYIMWTNTTGTSSLIGYQKDDEDAMVSFWFNVSFATGGNKTFILNVSNALGDTNENISYIGFLVAVSLPISITSPLNDTNYTTLVTGIDYTFNEEYYSICWYSLDYGITNTSVTCGTNASSLTSIQGENNWTMWINDTSNNVNSSFVTFFVDTEPPLIDLVNPNNCTNYTSIAPPVINFTIADVAGSVAGIDSCWYTNDSGANNHTLDCAEQNVTINNGTYNLSIDGIYVYTVYVNDSLGNVNSTSATIVLDNLAPNIDIYYPGNDSTLTSLTGIDYIVEEVGYLTVDGCWYTNDSGVTNYTITCGENISTTLSNDTYTYLFYVNDTLGNENFTSLTFVLSDTSATPSSGGSSGGTSWSTYVANTNEFANGFTKNFGVEERARVRVGTSDHYVGVTAVGASSATVQITSTPQTATFNVGDTKKFDVNNDTYWDILITLNSIASSKANLLIKSINEKIIEEVTTAEEETGGAASSGEETAPEEVITEPVTGKSLLWWILGVVLVAGAIGFIIFYAKSKK